MQEMQARIFTEEKKIGFWRIDSEDQKYDIKMRIIMMLRTIKRILYNMIQKKILQVPLIKERNHMNVRNAGIHSLGEEEYKN